jgi:hypothetical protein
MTPAKPVIVKINGIEAKDSIAAIEGYVLFLKRHGNTKIQHCSKGIIKNCEKLKKLIGPVAYEKQ